MFTASCYNILPTTPAQGLVEGNIELWGNHTEADLVAEITKTTTSHHGIFEHRAPSGFSKRKTRSLRGGSKDCVAGQFIRADQGGNSGP